MPASVTVLIRAKNEAALIGECLRGVAGQDYPGPVAVLVIDSGSTDRTVEIARSFPAVRVHQIPPAEFNYGKTLNDGIGMCDSEYVVPLSAHCVPTTDRWLAALTAPLDRDPRVAGAYGRQVPWPDCGFLEKAALAAAFGPADAVTNTPAGDLFDTVFSNANACVRRERAVAVPFQPLPWSEDRVWAHAMLTAGYRIAYAADAAVYHSHQWTARGWFRVGRADSRARRRLGLPARTATPAWFGVGRGISRFTYWYRQACRVRGGRRDALGLALGTLSHEIASDVGGWAGANGW
ncbi:MAG: glycosyltransferase [Gemmataceae bacterium]